MKINRKVRLFLKLVSHIAMAYKQLPIFISIVTGLYNNFIASSITFNLDTLFLNWNTTFPAVTVCEVYNGERVWDISDQYFGENHDMFLDDFVGEIVFYRGTCTTCEMCEEKVDECPTNFTHLFNMYRYNCSDLVINCEYMNSPFDCCEEFQPILTEYGVCFSFNSNQARRSKQTKFENNRLTGPGHLKFETFNDIQLHVHSPIEIPYIEAKGMLRETLLLGSNKDIIIDVTDVYNDPSIERLTIKERRCRFDYERTEWGEILDLFEYYSFPTCVVECTVAIQKEVCNCTSHVLSTGIKANILPGCDIEGLICLNDNYYDILEIRQSCDCMSPCEEVEFNIVYNSQDDVDETAGSTVINLRLIDLPTQRMVRLVSKTYYDLIISIGSVAGLFFNASLVRVIEIIFLIVKFNIFKKLKSLTRGLIRFPRRLRRRST